MRVVIIRSNPISPDSRVEKVADSLNRAGHKVTILGWDRSKKYKTKREKITVPSGEIEIYRMGIPADFGGGFKKNLIPMIKFHFKFILWLFIHSKEYDVIHACDFEIAYPASFCTKLFKKKLVYDIFDYYIASHNLPFTLSKFIERIDKKLINKADCVIICSEERKEQIKGTQPKVLEVIHNTPSKTQIHLDEKLSFKKKSNEQIVRIAYVGILSKSRLLEELIECVSGRNDCELHIGGFGQLESLVIEKERKYHNIHYYGKMPYHKTLQLEKECDILTAIYDPSIANHRYAAPNKFYEALLLGKPLIMAENTGMDKVVKEMDIGIVISYNQESLNNGITNLIARKKDWVSMADRMQNLYNQQYSWDIMDTKLRRVYKEIFKQSGDGS